MSKKDNKLHQSNLVEEVIIFLIDNEQYGDNWEEHIEVLTKYKEQLLLKYKDD